MKKIFANLKDLKENKRLIKKICAGGTAFAVLAASFVWAGSAGGSLAADEETAAETQETIEKTYPELLASGSTDGESSKEETVYVIEDADSNVTAISVSEWLRNGKGEDTITDVSTLKDIENTANDSGYTESGSNIIWQANGSDIKYKGTTDEELPVKASISYYLDGKKMSASEIAGKSGNVEIRFNYEVSSRTVSGGYSFTTPYTLASGVLLDDEHFKNVEVSNGKAIDDGSHCVCLGLAFPGLQSDLGIDSDDLEIPSYVSVKAYTDCFEIEGSYTVALSGLLADLDLDDSDSVEDKLSELESALDKLGSAAKKLVNGSSDLYDGTEDLLSGAESLYSGAASLYSGLETISDNSDDLNNGALQVFNTLLTSANTQLAASGLTVDTLTVSNYQKVLTDLINSLDDKIYAAVLEKVTAAVEANRQTIEDQVTAAVKEQVTEQVTQKVQQSVTEQVTAAVKAQVFAAVVQQATGMSVDDYNAAVQAGKISEEIQASVNSAVEQQMAASDIQAQIEKSVSGQMSSSSVKALIEKNVSEQMSSEDVKTLISQNVEATIQKLISEKMASEEVQEQLEKAKENVKPIISLKTSLDSYNAFYLGIQAYTNGVGQATEGAGDLANGAKQLKNGASKLADGAQTLYQGMKSFNKKGIKKLLSKLDDAGIEDILDRAEALIDASDEVRLIGGIADGMDGSSKIIIKTGAVKAEQ